MNNRLELQFVEYKMESYIEEYLNLIDRGITHIRLRPFNRFAADFLNQASQHNKQVTFYADESETPLPQNVSLMKEAVHVDATIIFAPEAKALSRLLMEYFDAEEGIIIAPITGHYFKNRPLFLISIPRSGTHLMYGLAESFGYKPGIVCPDNPSDGYWYCVEYSNSHTSAKDFFIETVRRSAFGNRHHPFTRNPAVFIYRNPMDIVVSEANYYHKEGKTAFYGYLSELSFEERLLRLINDPWLLGSIRERTGNFIPWLDFRNVIPVSFEELIGDKGGGDVNAQTRIIWSLQLKLNVPGRPQDYGEGVFNRSSATFHEGQIGSYRKYFTEKAYEKFYSLPQDFMDIFGYDSDWKKDIQKIPKWADKFRRRQVACSEEDFRDTPIAVEYNYWLHHIIRYRGIYYMVSPALGEVNLSRVDDDILGLKTAPDLNSAKQRIHHKEIRDVFYEELPRAFFTKRVFNRLKKYWHDIFSSPKS